MLYNAITSQLMSCIYGRSTNKDNNNVSFCKMNGMNLSLCICNSQSVSLLSATGGSEEEVTLCVQSHMMQLREQRGWSVYEKKTGTMFSIVTEAERGAVLHKHSLWQLLNTAGSLLLISTQTCLSVSHHYPWKRQVHGTQTVRERELAISADRIFVQRSLL